MSVRSGRILSGWRSGLLVAWLLSSAASATATSPDCATVADFVLPDVHIEAAERLTDPVPHCKVSGIIGPEIRFELLLPARWNGKFLMGGGGGFVGSVQNTALTFTDPLQRGYATSGTDTGHQAAGVDASWALHNMERLVNFGHVAVHRTTEVSKAITQLYYGNPAEHSYFIGCSRGGGQALMSAQRYPADFDGIIAGAPAYNWSGMAAHGAQVQQRMYPDPSSLERAVVSRANLELLQREILAACDSLDGLTDGILDDPRECDFELDSIPRCVENVPADDCFSDAQRAAIQVIYDGARDASGNQILAGFPYGGEAETRGWIPWMVGAPTPIAAGIPTLMFGFSSGIFKYFIHQNPDWDYRTQSFADFGASTALAASILNATDPDLSAFNDRGGKLLLWHGWADPALSANATIDYFESVNALDAEADDYLRLFMLPGMLHCFGGPGPHLVDYLTPLENWVEQGDKPDQLLAAFPGADGRPSGARPVCAYPLRARYQGGDDREPSNFRCE